jgi:lactate dehydrogenase-like 2-hydroxyacid dehydrogenase
MDMEQRPELVLLRDFPEAMMRALQSEYVVHRYFDAPDKEALIAATAARVRGIVTGSQIATPRSLIERFPRLEIIACFGVGVDPIDVACAHERGIVVTNTPDVLVADVADMGVTLLLAASRQIVQGDRFVREGRWLRGIMDFTHRVNGKRAGIVGCGRIGGTVARRLEAFDMSIAYHGPRDKQHPRYRYYADLEAMAAEVDFLVLTCPGGPATRHLVNKRVLDALGSEGILVNIARGSVVDEDALVEALKHGSIRAAGLDVYADEPRAPSALFELDNVVLSPHQSSATHETRAAMAECTLENLRAYFGGRPVPNPV